MDSPRSAAMAKRAVLLQAAAVFRNTAVCAGFGQDDVDLLIEFGDFGGKFR